MTSFYPLIIKKTKKWLQDGLFYKELGRINGGRAWSHRGKNLKKKKIIFLTEPAGPGLLFAPAWFHHQ